MKNMRTVMLTENELFFWENAGYSHDPATENEISGRARGAILLADAEKIMKSRGFDVRWEPDPEPWSADVPYYGPVWIASLHSPCTRHVTCDCDTFTGTVLGGIAINSLCPEQDSYGRVISAELMSSYLSGG